MRKIALFFVIAAAVISATACLKNNASTACTNRTVAADEPAILNYLNNNGITGYVKHSSGLYYKIDDPGSGATPTVSSKVYVAYSGRFTDNTVFDTLAVADAMSKSGWVLGTLIPGWQIGLPLIAKGGKIRLFIPSALGYGCQPIKDSGGNIVIPGNAILVFNVTLTDVQ